jgi:hypothetical protein
LELKAFSVLQPPKSAAGKKSHFMKLFPFLLTLELCMKAMENFKH